jgi:ubiquitin
MVLNMKINGKCSKGRTRLSYEQQVKKGVTNNEKELKRRSCEKTSVDGKA